MRHQPLSQFALTADTKPVLGRRKTICEFGPGTYPDGLALDSEGFLWVTSIVSNRILRVSPNGRSDIVFEDSVQAHIDWVESAYQSDQLGREHLDNVRAQQMKNISNLINRQRH